MGSALPTGLDILFLGDFPRPLSSDNSVLRDNNYSIHFGSERTGQSSAVEFRRRERERPRFLLQIKNDTNYNSNLSVPGQSLVI